MILRVPFCPLDPPPFSLPHRLLAPALSLSSPDNDLNVLTFIFIISSGHNVAIIIVLLRSSFFVIFIINQTTTLVSISVIITLINFIVSTGAGGTSHPAGGLAEANLAAANLGLRLGARLQEGSRKGPGTV